MSIRKYFGISKEINVPNKKKMHDLINNAIKESFWTIIFIS